MLEYYLNRTSKIKRCNLNNAQYTQELENFISDELLPAYIENCARLGRNPNQSYIIKKLLGIMQEKKPVPAIMRQIKPEKI